jgi:predicted dehydrogenase
MQNTNRRDFIKAAGATAAASLLATSPVLSATNSAKRRYAIVGTGHRATSMWGKLLVDRYSDVLDFVGLCDINPKRAQAGKELLGVNCPTFTDFDRMCAETKPDLLAVTTRDSVHVEYITKALDRKIDVITEKPMVIDARQVQAVLAAEKRNGRKITVAHNYRFSPKHQKIKEILLSGELGRVLSVDFSWYLDVYHGADYFRRWHRLKNGGGSLWVHKASHHFDLMNWWLAADPVEVAAQGALNVYGKNGAFRGDNCRTCPHKAKCPFFWDMTRDKRLMKLYAECEDVDNYHRDGCVYRQDVDIYDTMNALVKYSNGVTMSYSLNAAMPFEGFSLAFNCEKGRLDVRDYERQPFPVAESTVMYVTKSFNKREKIPVTKGEGGHDGGDNRLLDSIFRNPPMPEYMRLPDARAGAMSCLTGIAARASIEQKRPIKIGELVRL